LLPQKNQNKRALEQIKKKKIEIEREEKRAKEQIEIATKKYEITKELAEKKSRMDVCKRFEEEVAMLDFGDNDPNTAEEHVMNFSIFSRT
jgi:phenylalanyl-tRNA synthetase alpha subunit